MCILLTRLYGSHNDDILYGICLWFMQAPKKTLNLLLNLETCFVIDCLVIIANGDMT